jgi:hypothetical protein
VRRSPLTAERSYPSHLERRRARRFPYPAIVTIDRLSGGGIDISTGGLSVLLAEPLPIGTLVVVALGGGDDVTSHARVVRLAPTRNGVVIGMQFVD